MIYSDFVFLYFCFVKTDFFVNIKISYYRINKQELLQKAKEKYGNGGREKAAKYYQDNKEVLKEKARDKYKNLSEEEKEAKKEYSKNRQV